MSPISLPRVLGYAASLMSGSRFSAARNGEFCLMGERSSREGYRATFVVQTNSHPIAAEGYTAMSMTRGGKEEDNGHSLSQLGMMHDGASRAGNGSW